MEDVEPFGGSSKGGCSYWYILSGWECFFLPFSLLSNHFEFPSLEPFAREWRTTGRGRSWDEGNTEPHSPPPRLQPRRTFQSCCCYRELGREGIACVQTARLHGDQQVWGSESFRMISPPRLLREERNNHARASQIIFIPCASTPILPADIRGGC